MNTKKIRTTATYTFSLLLALPGALWACGGAYADGEDSDTAELGAAHEALSIADPELGLADDTAAPLAVAPAVAPVAAFGAVPTVGPITCSLQTSNGHYVTAVGAGGRTTDVIHTDATRVGSWERFTLIDSGDGDSIIHYGLLTANGHYLTAVGGGGRITDVIHSDATQLQAWEKFTFWSLGSGVYVIYTVDGHLLTAVGAGGRTTDTIHSDATNIGSWEKFRVNCTNP